MRGAFPTIQDNLAFIARKLGVEPTTEELARAVTRYERFTLEGLEPVEHAMDFSDGCRQGAFGWG